MIKYTLEYVKHLFEEQGCELLEKEYINNKVSMRYKCNCGNISRTTIKRIRRGDKCRKCGAKERANKTRLKFNFVYNFFKEQGCELLEKDILIAIKR